MRVGPRNQQYHASKYLKGGQRDSSGKKEEKKHTKKPHKKTPQAGVEDASTGKKAKQTKTNKKLCPLET